jgi:hypothetical protein
VLGNDLSNPDLNEALAITAVTQGTNGSVAITGGGSSVSYTPAANFNGSDSFTYTITDEHGGTATATANVTVLPSSGTPIQNWRQVHFGTTSNTGNAADLADPDNDGIANLLEYALNLSPIAASTLPAPQQSAGQFGYEFTRPAGATDVVYAAEWSNSLQSNDWQPIPNTGTEPQQRFLRSIAGQPRLFIRLKISR